MSIAGPSKTDGKANWGALGSSRGDTIRRGTENKAQNCSGFCQQSFGHQPGNTKAH